MRNRKKRYFKIYEDGICSHVEPVWLNEVEDEEVAPFGYFFTFSDAKKELVENQMRRLEDARDALRSTRADRKDRCLKEWDEYARKQAGVNERGDWI